MADVDLDYTGVHSFVFIHEVDPGTNIRDVIDDARSLMADDVRVRFAAETVGSYLGFAHLRTETLADLQGLIAGDLWERGVHCQHSVEADTAKRGNRLMGAKRSTPEVIALSRVHVQRNALRDVLDAMADEHGPLRDTFKGASVVFGDFDILLQLGGDSFDVVARDVYDRLQRIDGISSTDTAFTDARRYED